MERGERETDRINGEHLILYRSKGKKRHGKDVCMSAADRVDSKNRGVGKTDDHFNGGKL